MAMSSARVNSSTSGSTSCVVSAGSPPSSGALKRFIWPVRFMRLSLAAPPSTRSTDCMSALRL